MSRLNRSARYGVNGPSSPFGLRRAPLTWPAEALAKAGHPGEALGARACPRAGGDARERTAAESGLASPAAPEARLWPQTVFDLPALLRGQDRGRVSERLHDAFAGRVGERQLLRAKRLDGGAVDRRPQQQLTAALARGVRLLAHRNEITHRRFDHGAQPLLLLVGGVDLDRQMPDQAVGAILDLRRIHLAHHEAAAMPAAVAERPEAGLTEGLAGKECRRANTSRNQESKKGGTPAATPHRRGRAWIGCDFGHLCLHWKERWPIHWLAIVLSASPPCKDL